MATTYETMLEQVQTAIAAILGGAQKYEIRDRTYERADLETLFRMEKEYRRLAARTTAGGIKMRLGVKA